MGALSKFVGLMRDGGMAKLSHFTVRLNLPLRLNVTPFTEKRDKIVMFCDQAQIPGVSFGSSQIRSYGEFREVPYEKLYEPINLSFYVDNSHIVKSLFDEWMSLVQDQNTRDFNYPRDYLSDVVEILIQDSTIGNNKTNYIVKLHECYPKSVSPIQLDYSSKDVMKCNVTLVYRYATKINTHSREMQLNESFIPGQEFLFNFEGVPENYLSDFFQFQNDFSVYDVSFDGARTSVIDTEYMQDVIDPRG